MAIEKIGTPEPSERPKASGKAQPVKGGSRSQPMLPIAPAQPNAPETHDQMHLSDEAIRLAQKVAARADTSSLDAARKQLYRDRIQEGYYDSPTVTEAIALSLLADHDL